LDGRVQAEQNYRAGYYYNLGMSHMSSSSFLSDLSKALRNGFHSSFSILKAILNEGTVLPIC
jgi:hypothetical protein